MLSLVNVTTKIPFYCNKHAANQFYHLKSEERNTCMGLKDGTEDHLIRWKCNNDTALQWMKDPVPVHSKSDGATRICHSSGNKCLAVKLLKGKYQIVFNPYNHYQHNQRWKIIETGQFVNFESRLCLTSYSSNKNPTDKSNNLLYGMEKCVKKKQDIIALQKWSLVLLPKCKTP